MWRIPKSFTCKHFVLMILTAGILWQQSLVLPTFGLVTLSFAVAYLVLPRVEIILHRWLTSPTATTLYHACLDAVWAILLLIWEQLIRQQTADHLPHSHLTTTSSQSLIPPPPSTSHLPYLAYPLSCTLLE